MPFSKNDKNINIQGRKKGTPNTNTKDLKFLIGCLFYYNLEQVIEHEESLNITQRLNLNKTLLPYVLPIQKDIETFDEFYDADIVDYENKSLGRINNYDEKFLNTIKEKNLIYIRNKIGKKNLRHQLHGKLINSKI